MNPRVEEAMSHDKRKKILIVDDEINVCKSMRQAILSESYAVDMALSGEEALAMDKENPYDMVITDLMMPGISGVRSGAFDYIPKPFTPDELRGLVARAFTRSQTTREEKKDQPPPMPRNLFCLRGHTWLRKEGTNRVTVGVVYELLQNIDQISAIELLAENKSVFQGEVCARLTDARGYIHRVWSPATGRISQTNTAVTRDPGLLLRDPYGEGWLLRLETTNLDPDLESLIPS
jgi:glycine cleavage system H lipoate-binding protein/CheY-like chemotaxis protein